MNDSHQIIDVQNTLGVECPPILSNEFLLNSAVNFQNYFFELPL